MLESAKEIKESRKSKYAGGQVSLKTIAEETGLSVMTVSRALRNHSDIACETRERVLEVAQRLRYRPNLLVRAIQTGVSKNIGVVIAPIGSFGSRIVIGIHDELATEQYLPLLHWKHSPDPRSSEQGELDVINRLLDRRVDGVILFPRDDSVPDLYFREVWQRKIPLVTIDRQLRFTHADFVGTDDTFGAELAARHLLELGHRHFAHVAGDPKFGTYADRRTAFEAAIAAHAKCLTVVVDDLNKKGIAEEMRRILTLKPRPTAIFLASDAYAQALYSEAAALKIQIPRDLSVVGFADLEFAAFLQPGLTTVRQDSYAIGRTAARFVMDRCLKKVQGSEPLESRLKPELIVRASTGRASSRR